MGRVHREVQSGDLGAEREIPETIGGYRVRGRLGAGGLGVVYEAERADSGAPVALKVIHLALAKDPEALRLFEREARALSRLRHPAIARIHEADRTEDGREYITMELVRGNTLSEWQTGRSATAADPGELRVRLGLFRQIAEAIAYAHGEGVIHKDLKPSNIVVLGGDAGLAVKVLDFGLARAAFLSGVTEPGRIRGTLPYMSPEQARGAPDEIDERTDVYSLGVILYELVSGSRPYALDQDTFVGKIRAILTAEPAPLSGIWRAPDASVAALDSVVRKALEKDPANRHATIPLFLEALDRAVASLPGEEAG